MTKFGIIVYEDSTGYEGFVYTDTGKKLKEIWDVETLIKKQDFFTIMTKEEMLRIRSSEVKVITIIDSDEIENVK